MLRPVPSTYLALLLVLFVPGTFCYGFLGESPVEFMLNHG